MGLEGLISARKEALHGIVNGIDTEVWNPETDPLLAAPFSAKNLKGRAANRAADRGPLRPPGRRLAALHPHQPPDLAEGHRPPRLDHRRGHRPRRPPPRRPRHRRARPRVHLPGAGRRVPRPRRHDHRLRRAPRPPDAGRRRRHRHPLALRALRPDPALRPALRLRADRRPHRRPRRHRDRRQPRGAERRRRHRLPVHARSTPRRSPAPSAAPPTSCATRPRGRRSSARA